MGIPQIALYFDIGSPFSYIAFHALRTSPVFSNCQIEYVPVLLRDLFQKCQNPPPITVKNKLQWINKERLYWASRFGVPMSETVPKGFPAATADLQTALAGISKHAPEKLIAVTAKLFSIFWGNGDTSIVIPEKFTAVFESEMGRMSDATSVQDLSNAASKEILDKNTEMAFASGAFGLPWFECTNTDGDKEGFWGIDHLGRVADYLGAETSLDEAFKVLI
ncbi:2-hydroxychromene-2-carboxylate isomerase [Penicillium argentinense]|uniref:Glutathione S-transferase kappa n=1 Tax=Penicillium argentinense TaxID=1131581 RepID=A0A9W9JY75_9EURO|nr:2-hydroxychromene-2-carboxylate isomerase [Penicillium argentinense]KAJ5085963.1 2-hydroxychromene-2-carboxylate isomerase [Penicillium argentinense]